MACQVYGKTWKKHRRVGLHGLKDGEKRDHCMRCGEKMPRLRFRR